MAGGAVTFLGSMETAEGRRSRRLNPPNRFERLSDELAISVFVRTPFTSHDNVRACCQRTNALLRSPEFREERIESGYAEEGIVIVGENETEDAEPATSWVVVGGLMRPIAKMSRPRYGLCSTIANGEVFAIGVQVWGDGRGNGHGWTGEDGSVEIYNPQTDEWRLLPNMIEPRGHAVCGVVGGSLVVAGRLSDSMGRWPKSSAEQLSLVPTGEWEKIPQPPHVIPGGMSCVLNGQLYTAGGWRSKKVQRWDGQAWSVLASMPEQRYCAASVVYEGCWWLIGGHCFENENGWESEDEEEEDRHARYRYGTTDSVIFYDPQTNAWHEAEPLPQPLKHGNAIVIDGELVVVQMFIDGAVSFCYFKGQGWGQLPEAIAQKIPPINRNMRINNLGSVLVG